MKPRILLVDDDPVDLKTLALLVQSWEMDVVTARSGTAALEALAAGPVDLVLSDLRMPGMDGDVLVRRVAEDHPGLPVILVTGQADVRSAVTAMRAGAFDYVLKPPDADELRCTVDRALEHGALRRTNAFLQAQLAAAATFGDLLVGRSPGMLAVMDVITRVAGTDTSVLVTGETGTGKELVARAIHLRSRRAARPLVAVNCAALSAGLIESELFGHEKGAFTGAMSSRRGRFEEADGGTLFLDEIAETTPEFQAKLLRVLQDGEFQRVGGNETIRVDVRLITATNRVPLEALRSGKLREDLYYRLNVIPIELPPLRERGDDILLLATHFLARYRERYGVKVHGLTSAAQAVLLHRPWKGNVRELQHVIERAVVLARGELLDVADLGGESGSETVPKSGATLEAVLDQRTREYVREVLDGTGWNKQRAAERLGIDRVTLYRLLKKLSLERSAE